jgi:hypothetical protein
VCEQLLNEALPRVAVLPGMRGYVWRGGFTIYRASLWHSGFRAMGTGHFEDTGPLTRIKFRVGLGRFQAYALAIYALLFGGIALAAIPATLARASNDSALVLPILVVVTLITPVLLAGRMPKSDGQRSEEADRLLTFLRQVIGAEADRS